MAKLNNEIKSIKRFLQTDIWRIRLGELHRGKAFFYRQLRIFTLALRGFHEDRCSLRASALTFYSLLSVVPFVAALFGISKGFGLQQFLEKQLLEKFHEHQTIMFQIIDFSKAMLENTKGGLIAGIGILVLFWSVIKLLANIETSLNDIWAIKTPRTIVRKLSDYLSIMVIAPLILIVSSGLTVFIKIQITAFMDQFTLLGFMAPPIAFLIKSTPYLMIWLLFILIYIVIPNSKVNFVAGFYAAVIAGTLYQLTQWLFITFQVGAASYNAIYGSFAALPLFLIWLQISWFIVLLGAELSYAFQNVDSYEFESDSKQISPHYKRILSLLTAHTIIKNFESGKEALNGPQIADKLEIPMRLVRTILSEFIESGLFVKVSSEEYKEAAYQPAADIQRFTIKYIIDALDNHGSEDIGMVRSDEFKKLSKTLSQISDSLEKSPLNKLLKDL